MGEEVVVREVNCEKSNERRRYAEWSTGTRNEEKASFLCVLGRRRGECQEADQVPSISQSSSRYEGVDGSSQGFRSEGGHMYFARIDGI